MIELIGIPGSSEYLAAKSIYSAIAKQWPGIENSPSAQQHVKIAANVKISGYKVADIDIVVCGVFSKERNFIPTRTINDKQSKKMSSGKPVSIKNFIIAIEVKDHSGKFVRVLGDTIEVYYSRGNKWKNAVDQNIDQVHTISSYAGHMRINNAWIHRCVIMSNLEKVESNGVLTGAFSGSQFFTEIASLSSVHNYKSKYELSSGDSQSIRKFLEAPIFQPVEPSVLDRAKMDHILSSTPESENLLRNIGKKMVILRGHGGTGKTIMFLQAAWKLFEQSNSRTLVLTYNHALAADIRRLLALLRIPSNPDEGGIKVDTVMSFMYSWFRKLQLLDYEEDLSFDNYDQNCQTVIELLKGSDDQKKEISAIKFGDGEKFDFDFVFVDEAQDWPKPESELLKELYPSSNICLADGINQVSRVGRPSWDSGVGNIEIIALKRCLRMKRNLSGFSNIVAEQGGLRWEVTPNELAGGGKVIILDSSYTYHRNLHEKLVQEAKALGNSEIDFLFCVPPSNVYEENGERFSMLSDWLTENGDATWDGVDERRRKDFPRSVLQFRVLQYASCRGLEGWTVVLEGLDEYWNHEFEKKLKAGLTKDEELAMKTAKEVAETHAWLMTMIPLTRPIDTLVITLTSENEAIKGKLKTIVNDLSF